MAAHHPPCRLVVASVHGAHCQAAMIPECAAEVAAAGFLFLPSNAFDGLYPESYQMTYHTREYVLDRFSQYFDVLAYLPQGMAGYQDVVVLGRR